MPFPSPILPAQFSHVPPTPSQDQASSTLIIIVAFTHKIIAYINATYDSI